MASRLSESDSVSILERLAPERLARVRRVVEQAGSIRGDFPTSLQLVSRIRETVNQGSATPQQVADVLMLDPILTVRLLAIVNSSLYARGRAIRSLSGTVNHLGLMRIDEIAADVARAENYQALFLGRANAACVFQSLVLAAHIARGVARLFDANSETTELAYAATVLRGLPNLFLSTYAPHLYALAVLGADDDRTLFERLGEKILGEKTAQVASGIAQRLGLPEDYSRWVANVDVAPWNRRGADMTPGSAAEFYAVCAAVYTGQRIASELMNFPASHTFHNFLRDLARKLQRPVESLQEIVGGAPALYRATCESLGAKTLRAVEHVERYAPVIVDAKPEGGPEPKRSTGVAERMNPFLYELRAAFRTEASDQECSRLGQAILCTLNAFIRGLNFDRALYLVIPPGQATIEAEYMLGMPIAVGTESRGFRRALGERGSAVVEQCIATRRHCADGEPLIEGGWPFFAFPAVVGGEVIGVFYADKPERTQSVPLHMTEVLASTALAEEWSDVSGTFAGGGI